MHQKASFGIYGKEIKMKNRFLPCFLLFLITACQTTTGEQISTTTVELTDSPTAVIETTSTVIPPTPTPKPDIVFVSDRDGDSEIFVMESNGNNVTQLTENESNDWNPKWSPDGMSISFDSDRDGFLFPYIMNSDGSNQRLISQNLPDEYHLLTRWAPDGQKIAVWNENIFCIVTVTDGSLLFKTQATSEETFRDASWSPTGKQIALTYDNGSKSTISILSVDEGDIKPIARLDDFVQLILWSPDGNKIAFSASCGMDCAAAVFVINPDGSNLVKLTDNSDPHWIRRWTSDSKYILYDFPNSAFLINIDGSEKIHLVDDPMPSYVRATTWYVKPTLSPDGQQLAFSSGRDGQGEIYIANIDGSGLTNITNHPANDTSPDWANSTSQELTSILSNKVAAFYYPWYGDPTNDHWAEAGHTPPLDISSDFYPMLGAYSSRDRQVVEQHMEWLRQAGIGVIIVSWWGQGKYEDETVPLLLEIAQKYGIKIAFHIEPYVGRSSEKLVQNVQYIYEKYSDSPAFYWTNATSRYSRDIQPKGIFFVWNIGVKGWEGESVDAAYWQKAMDEIHALPNGGLIIANTMESSWIDQGHFDGLYNYATLSDATFSWARSLAPDALYVPSVIPGFSVVRVRNNEPKKIARENGATYNSQWTAALGTGVEPALVTITSFNEWHEGTMIEPIQLGMTNGKGYSYMDFDSLPPDGYLNLTQQWIKQYQATQWPATYRARIKISTTSDWTTLNTVSGGAWIRPSYVSAGGSITKAGLEAETRFVLTQSLDDAKSGKQVEMTWDVMFIGLKPDQDLVLQIDRGYEGSSKITIYNYIGATPVEIKNVIWDGITQDRNSHTFTIPSSLLLNPPPKD